jgi:hypothetical protein
MRGRYSQHVAILDKVDGDRSIKRACAAWTFLLHTTPRICFSSHTSSNVCRAKRRSLLSGSR